MNCFRKKLRKIWNALFLTSKSCFAEHDYYLDFRLQKFIGYENEGYLFLLSIVLFQLSVHAQELKSLRGRVFDKGGAAIVGAIVSCTELPDSTAIAQCLTHVEGDFQFTGLKKNHHQYLLEVSYLGYERAYVNPSSEDMVIRLKESATALDEVVVRATAPQLKQKSGKFIYTPHLSVTEGIDSYDRIGTIQEIIRLIDSIRKPYE